MIANKTNKMDALQARRKTVEEGGGKEKVAKHHAKGCLTARERILTLLDPGSFSEIGTFVKHRCIDFGLAEADAPGEGVVTGTGTIDGRTVYVYAQDFTVLGGSLGEMHAKKICTVQELALKAGCPLICINDSGGARIQEGIAALAGYSKIFFRNTQASGVVPQIAAILGPCAGGAAYSPALCDFVIMSENNARMFITGPQVIKTVTGEDVSSEEIGGALVHNSKSGNAHFRAADDLACFEKIKELLSFLPQNNLEAPPYRDTQDDPNRADSELDAIIPDNPSKGYDVKDVIQHLVDEGDFFEVQPEWAQNIVIGFARLNGQVVGVVANQPKVYAGCLDIDASDKAGRFVRTCDAFNIPLLTLVDVPGFLPGTSQEFGGIIRHGAKLLYAYSESTVPKVTVMLRKAYGGAYIAMCSKDLGSDMVFAWPQAEIAVMGPDGAANIIFKREIEASDSPETVRAQKIEEFKDKFATPYVAAGLGLVDDVILPSETRPRIIKAFEALQGKRESRWSKKHGNIPV
ncbi:MAG: acyl-CoA carboxylase subunit beta [Bacteroidota bacterium]